MPGCVSQGKGAVAALDQGKTVGARIRSTFRIHLPPAGLPFSCRYESRRILRTLIEHSGLSIEEFRKLLP